MANNNKDTTTTLGIDISQFKRGLQDAQRQIKLANAEFKAAAAGMDKWSDSATGVQAKIKQLETTLDAENKKLELQKQRLIEVEREQGKNSAGANELRIAIANQQASIAKTEKSLSDYNGKLKDLQNAENQAKTATGALTDTIGLQQNKLDALKQKYTDVVLAQGANSKEAKALGAQISALSGDLATNKQKMADAENAADKLDKSLTDVGDAATEAGKDAENAANGGFTVLKGVMANLATQAINAALNGLKSMGSALLDVGKQAVAGYAEMEQLKGGVEKLFGDSADTVINYANNAFKTAGMNANDYMETVTSFSASLISGLGGDTAEAARIADVAITDMADNANTFGTSMQDIQNAYQGFAKGNFTMLDNLKLGYGGTQAEMLRLVHDAGVVDESITSINDVSFDQIIESIHIIQENMNIAGATAAEAAHTIEGSANAMKAAWGNLVTGLADENADLDGLINNFIESLLTYAGNIMPVIQTAIGGISTLILRLVQDLLPQALNILTSELPNFLNTGAELLISLISGILSATPQLTSAILSAADMILNTFSHQIPNIVSLWVDMFPQITSAILSAAPQILQAGITLLMSLVNSIPLILPYFQRELPRLINMIVRVLNQGIPLIIRGGLALLNGLLQAIPLILPAVVPQIGKLVVSLVNALVSNAPLILDAAIHALNAIVEALPIIADSLTPEIINLVLMVSQCLIDNAPVLASAALQFFWVIITEVLPQLFGALVDLATDFIEIFVETWLKPVIQSFKDTWQAIQKIFSVVAEWFGEQFTKAYLNIQNAFKNIGSWFSDRWTDIKNALANVATWFSENFTAAYTNVKNAFSAIGSWFGQRWTDIKNIFSNVGTWFKSKFSDAWTKIKQVFAPVGEFFGGIWDTIKEKFTAVGTSIGDAVSGAFTNVVNSVLSGAIGIINRFIRGINGVIDIVNDLPGVSISRLSELSVPQLERGGILKRGQVGLLEGNGSEAVVPLDQNKKWINSTARAMNDALSTQGVINNNGGNVTNNYNFTQNNTSPKALSRLEIYRQTKNQFNFATGATGG
ncbi:MAG: hypothetical protein IKT42_06420 [Clostridia bacterium]|nr:hypothetical protein [Clostridia bacterium]